MSKGVSFDLKMNLFFKPQNSALFCIPGGPKKRIVFKRMSLSEFFKNKGKFSY